MSRYDVLQELVGCSARENVELFIWLDDGRAIVDVRGFLSIACQALAESVAVTVLQFQMGDSARRIHRGEYWIAIVYGHPPLGCIAAVIVEDLRIAFVDYEAQVLAKVGQRPLTAGLPYCVARAAIQSECAR